MILSICPNPSIDCTIELEQLNVGQLNRIENKIITYSGKALNTAIGVKRLGGDSYATGFMYEQDGRLFTQRLDDEGVKNTFVWNKGSVRTNYKFVDNKSMLTEINDWGEEVSAKKQQELISLVENLSKTASVVVMSGSLPKGVPNDFYKKLCAVIPKTVKIIVDSEGEKLLKALENGVYMVKPNLKELENTLNKKIYTFKEMLEGANVLLDKGAQNVMLSLGSDGAILTDGSKTYFCKSATVAVNSTVGAGDSMVSACAVMTERNAPQEEILRCSVAAGTASITTPGTNLFYRDKFEEIYDKIFVKEV